MFNLGSRSKRGVLPALTAVAMVAVGICAVPEVAHADTQPSHFVWTATSSNITADRTAIDNGATNSEPGALLFVTPPTTPAGCVGASMTARRSAWPSTRLKLSGRSSTRTPPLCPWALRSTCWSSRRPRPTPSR